jgi:hypothetical protein
MEWLVKDIESNGKVTSAAEAEKRSVPNFEAKLNPEVN